MKDSGVIIHELHCEISELKKEIEELKKTNFPPKGVDWFGAFTNLYADEVKVSSVTIPIGGRKCVMRKYTQLTKGGK